MQRLPLQGAALTISYKGRRDGLSMRVATYATWDLLLGIDPEARTGLCMIPNSKIPQGFMISD